MKSIAEIQSIIDHASGTEAYHRFSPIPGFPVVTDGVKALAEAAECYWLLDLIGSYQGNQKLDPAFQVWRLEVNHDDDSAVAYGFNDADLIIMQTIPFTDFPLDEVDLFLMDGIILLPSEY